MLKQTKYPEGHTVIKCQKKKKKKIGTEKPFHKLKSIHNELQTTYAHWKNAGEEP